MEDKNKYPSEDVINARNVDFYKENIPDEKPPDENDENNQKRDLIAYMLSLGNLSQATKGTYPRYRRKEVLIVEGKSPAALEKNPAAEEIKPEPIKHHYSQQEIDGVSMLKLLAKNPFLKYKDIITELNLSPLRGDKAREWVINSGYAKDRAISIIKKPGQYFELLGDAYTLFGGKPPVGKGSFEHKCFCNLIKEYYEGQGYGVRLEGIVEGINHPVDCLVWKEGEGMFGVEVTLSFENLVSNVKTCLSSTLKKVIIVCSKKEDVAKALSIVKKAFDDKLPSNIVFNTIADFKS